MFGDLIGMGFDFLETENVGPVSADPAAEGECSRAYTVHVPGSNGHASTQDTNFYVKGKQPAGDTGGFAPSDSS
jgi:hypothetical protein